MSQFIPLENISVAELTIKYLELEGITHVFGIPGGYISPFLEILRDHPTIKLIIPRHEEGAAFMADGYARLTGKLGVVLTTAGPGATNALTGVTCAHIDNIPLMLIVGQSSTATAGIGAWQDSSYAGVNICEIFRPVCAMSEMAMHAENFPSLIARALRVIHGSPKQTIHLSLPINISSAKIARVDFPLERNYIFPTNNPVLQGAENNINKLFDIIASSQNPLFFIGAGCQEALRKPDILALFSDFVARHKIPVMTTPKAKGLFPEDHALSLGVFGLGGSLHSNAYLEQYSVDTLIVLGSSLNEWASAQWDQKLKQPETFIQVDINPAHIGRVYPVHEGLVCDIEVFIRSLMMIEKQKNPLPNNTSQPVPSTQTIEQFKQKNCRFLDVDKMDSNEYPLKPQRAFCELSHFIANKKMAIFLDIGNSTGFFSHYVQLNTAHSFYSSYGFTCMGWAVGSAIGGKIAAPDLTCMAVTGDGAFLMNGVEIQTAARYKIGIVCVVLFDDCYGMVEHGMKAISNHVYLEDNYYSLGSPDLVKFSESLGAESYWVDAPGQLENILAKACKNANDHRKPQVIIVKIDPNEAAPFGARYKAIKSEINH